MRLYGLYWQFDTLSYYWQSTLSLIINIMYSWWQWFHHTVAWCWMKLKNVCKPRWTSSSIGSFMTKAYWWLKLDALMVLYCTSLDMGSHSKLLYTVTHSAPHKLCSVYHPIKFHYCCYSYLPDLEARDCASRLYILICSSEETSLTAKKVGWSLL